MIIYITWCRNVHLTLLLEFHSIVYFFRYYKYKLNIYISSKMRNHQTNRTKITFFCSEQYTTNTTEGEYWDWTSHCLLFSWWLTINFTYHRKCVSNRFSVEQLIIYITLFTIRIRSLERFNTITINYIYVNQV